jgi:hypothetical protein
VALLLVGCTGVYTDTWQPLHAEGARGYPRLVSDALFVRDDDVAAVEQAGGELLGYHEVQKKWARRVGSIGGTHFFPVERADRGTRMSCGPVFGVLVCRSRDDFRWSRVAAVRVDQMRWHELPPHLIPPASVMEDGVHASAYRTGCRVHNSYGSTKCSNSWRVVTAAPR